LLIDSCLPPRLARALNAEGHDALHLDDLGSDPGDEAIVGIAIREQRAIVTQDKDLGMLALRPRRGPLGVLRIKRVPNRLFVPRVLDAIARHGADLRSGAIVTVEVGRLRIRRLPAV
jgi:predicted nuclease of predicted toxin-antitoxin system